MNYLGHLYFSNNDIELMYANLFGDFVKGKDFSHYPDKIQKGIRLHRTIDHYIDNHPAVIELLHELYKPLPKIAGIAIDLMFDHILAKNWSAYHDKNLEVFLDEFHKSDFDHAKYDKQRFLMVMEKMKEARWIYHYKTMFGLTKACEGLSSRISFPNELHRGPEVFLLHQESIEKAFEEFMKDAIPFYEKYYKQHQL